VFPTRNRYSHVLRRKVSWGFTFLVDDQDLARLPTWVAYPKQVTDGHLWQLAKSKQAELATLDKRIPGVFLIPG